MKLSQAKQATRVALRANIMAMLYGPPGGGKSQGLDQLCAEEGYDVLDWRATELESVDLRGTPHAENRRTVWFPPAELPTVRKDGKIVFQQRGKEVVTSKLVVKLDELPQAKLDAKNVLARFILERRIGEWTMPPQCRILGAGNRMEDAAGASPMPTHLNNRMWHINVVSSFEDWMTNFVEPRESGEPPLSTPQFRLPLREINAGEIIPIDTRVVAYLKYQSSALFDRDPRSKDPAFASSRSWHMLSDLLYVLNGNENDLDAVLFGEYCSGCVGNAHGQQFSAFVRTVTTLVSIEQILLDPENAPVPTEASICYALSSSLAAQVNRKTIGSGFTYLRRLSDEFVELFANKIKKIQPNLQQTKAFTDWGLQSKL